MYTTALDIANRACQHVGAPRIASLSENSKAATEINFCYDKLRQAELQAHLWRFSIRKAPLRALTSTTKFITFPTYAAGTTYQQGDIVNDTSLNAGISGQSLYISLKASNTGNQPSAAKQQDMTWTPYYGPDVAESYSTTHTYSIGELVWVTTSTYLSLQNANINQAVGSSPWTATLTGASNATLFVPYPYSQFYTSDTRSAYRLPYGHLRMAPQDPKIAGGANQTASGGMQFADYQLEGNLLLSNVTPATATLGPLILRFGADIADPTLMQPLFCEVLAARIGMEICETVTGNKNLKQLITARYNQLIQTAYRDDMLEQGSTDPAEMGYDTNRSLTNLSEAPAERQQPQG